MSLYVMVVIIWVVTFAIDYIIVIKDWQNVRKCFTQFRPAWLANTFVLRSSLPFEPIINCS